LDLKNKNKANNQSSNKDLKPTKGSAKKASSKRAPNTKSKDSKPNKEITARTRKTKPSTSSNSKESKKLDIDIQESTKEAYALAEKASNFKKGQNNLLSERQNKVVYPRKIKQSRSMNNYYLESEGKESPK